MGIEGGAATHEHNLPLDSAAMQSELLAQRLVIAELVNKTAVLLEANQNLTLASVDAQNLRDAAELSNRRQNEFLAMLAHELRNPLAPISLANAMLARLAQPPPELLNLQAIIQRQVDHLTRLLDDLLDAARINSGKISLVRAPLDLVDLLRRSVETIQARMLDRRQQIALALPADMVVDGDPVRLAQAFANLLVNASKYSGEGGVIRLAARAEGGRAVVTVADNGAGLAPDVMPHIFDLFTQGPRTLARGEGGLGVGLNVVRNIVELHGGSVEVASEGLGRGSVFTVWLPLSHAPETTTAPARPVQQAPHRRILVVEDNLDANDTLGRLLLSEGHQVTSAYDGIAGLAMVRERDFDVLICDIGLPGLDGLKLLAALRSTPGAHIPFAIAISGYGQIEDRMRAIGAGYGQYFVKPVDIRGLLALVASDTVTSFISSAKRTR